MKVICTEIAVCTWTSKRICVARLTANFLAVLKIPSTKGLLVYQNMQGILLLNHLYQKM